MRMIKEILWAAGITASLVACKKSNTVTYTPSATINVTNAVIGGGMLTYDSTYQYVYHNSNTL